MELKDAPGGQELRPRMSVQEPEASFEVLEGAPEADTAASSEGSWPGSEFIAPVLIFLIIVAAPLTGATREDPLLDGDQAVFGLMLMILYAVFSTETSENPALKAFYTVVPSLLLCYFVPGLCSTLHVINGSKSKLYAPIARDYLLPSCLVLLTISIDMPAIKNLGWKAIAMFFAGTIGVMFGGPFAFLVMRVISPATIAGDEVWRGFATLAGSWIGGGANQVAMKEIFNANENIFAKVIVVDTLAANLWLGLLLLGARHRERIDAWLQADASSIDVLATRLANYADTVKRIPTTNDLVLLATVGFASTGLAGFSASRLAPLMVELGENNDIDLKRFGLGSEFFWLVVICTTLGFLLSFTPLRRLEGVGASKVGSVFLYILVTSIGMKIDFVEVAKDPLLILVGLLWIFFIACFLILSAKVLKAPLFFLAVGSQANIGGAASAPVIAAAFNPALASVGVLLAVLGYAVGTYGALLCGYMLEYVHPA